MEYEMQKEYSAVTEENRIISQDEETVYASEDKENSRGAVEGKTIGKYKMLRSLGQGGEGSVYLARDEKLQRLVAIKCVRKPGTEAEHLQRLRHPMLPVIYDLFQDVQGVWYLVMEYLQGVTLQKYIEKNGFVQEGQARIWAAQLADVLVYLHRSA